MQRAPGPLPHLALEPAGRTLSSRPAEQREGAGSAQGRTAGRTPAGPTGLRPPGFKWTFSQGLEGQALAWPLSLLLSLFLSPRVPLFVGQNLATMEVKLEEDKSIIEKLQASSLLSRHKCSSGNQVTTQKK